MWKIEELLQIIKGEVEAREISDVLKVNEMKYLDITHQSAAGNMGTASSLTVKDHGPGRRKCVYCGEDHYLASCEKVKDLSTRKDLIKRDRRCFICLAQGHHAAQCHSVKRCRKCNNRHHQSVCEMTAQRHNKQRKTPQTVP